MPQRTNLTTAFMSMVFIAITEKQMVYCEYLKQRDIESTKLMPDAQ